MTQEDKELLLKDLCCRLPYKVKIETLDGPQEFDIKWLSINMCNIANPYLPYLYPLSSMTEEQRNDLTKFVANGIYDENIIYDWYNKNNFDYRGLIEKGLAIDCTNLNIY